MKKIILTLVIALSSLVCVSCAEARAADDNIYQNQPCIYTKSQTSVGRYGVFVIQIEGHDYIMVYNLKGGVGLCHAAHCSCFSQHE